MLLTKGTDPRKLDAKGRTALQIARSLKSLDFIKKIEEFEDQIFDPIKRNDSAALIKALSNGVSASFETGDGVSLLHVAGSFLYIKK